MFHCLGAYYPNFHRHLLLLLSLNFYLILFVVPKHTLQPPAIQTTQNAEAGHPQRDVASASISSSVPYFPQRISMPDQDLFSTMKATFTVGSQRDAPVVYKVEKRDV